MTDGQQEEISVRARFERFPATVKGAFVLRGEDPNPHLVVFREARVLPAGTKSGQPIAMKAGTLDLPPHQDVFLPFEFSITDLEAGWYDLECDLDVDGIPTTFDGGRRFVVPWPRGAVRRGTIAIGAKVEAGSTVVVLDQIDVTAEQSALRYSVEPSSEISIRLVADGERLPELESEFDEETGAGRIVFGPLLRAHTSGMISIRSGKDEAEAEVTLP
jgi:hypothetical protein